MQSVIENLGKREKSLPGWYFKQQFLFSQKNAYKILNKMWKMTENQ